MPPNTWDSLSWGTHQHSMCLYPFQAMLATTAPGLHRIETAFRIMLSSVITDECCHICSHSWLKECSSLDTQLLESQSHELGPPVHVMVCADMLPALHCDRDDLHKTGS